MSTLKPIVVWGHDMGPNPLKVHIVLEELDIPFDYKIISFSDMKKEPFLSINPNGRVPAIEDPNTGVTIWESGPILEYIIDQYDKENKLSYDTLAEKYQIKQWIAFQISGQGPYYGQAVWFSRVHHEKLPSAIERYTKEMERVRSVLELHLSRSPSGWLVGDKMTVADLAWVMWEQIGTLILLFQDIHLEGKYPHYDAWYKKLLERPTVRKVLLSRTKSLRESGLAPDAPDPF
ncbi:glutathione S-transferase [Hypoxylon fragiforme]|uniref:glutathione S-transferase n=1 Tax=Hypoxylon fragiforme TaxID=63214 RepID=UPI0020C695D0|nr:glutathione S-transferase [Hypoxylon fragiforme]KAI2606303.1 glutathione S-transferase [Hypoxylon fragiforme]